MAFNLTLVRSRLKSRPYVKIDGRYRGPTWTNNIGLQTVPDDIAGIFDVLKKLSDKPDTCMVMGTATHPEIIDTDRTLKNFVEEPIRMLVLDLDKYKSSCVSDKMSYKSALKASEEFIKKFLPPEFHDVSYILRFSSSFLLKDTESFRAHIIFILEEAQYPREIGMWIKQEGIPADATFYFNLTQPIFTAAPLWENVPDPLKFGRVMPRISLVRNSKDFVKGDWQPYNVKRYRTALEVGKLPMASQLPGKMGSFCRSVPMERVLDTLGYTEESEGRYLAPGSSTGIPGAIIFKNGFVFSHHDGDPINRVVEKEFNFKRKSLNAYDLMYGWAKINKDDADIVKEFDFQLKQAVIQDGMYQDEVQQTLTRRTEWLTEGGYEGPNRKIIDSIAHDMYGMGLTNLSREVIFKQIKEATKGAVKLPDLRGLWKSIKQDRAVQGDVYDPEANLRHMANIFKRQKIIFSHHKTLTGDYWCFFSDARIWKLCNQTQAKAFVYNHIHSSMPVKIEIDYVKVERLTNLILRETCLSMSNFRKGRGWAFRGGKFGLSMENLFTGDWSLSTAMKTLTKADHVYKELPVTYKDWIDTSSNPPKEYIDFLINSCEEDIESVELLREFGGYVLADSYYLHKMLILEGVPGSGKSVFAKVLQEIVGAQYCSAVSISGLANQFGLGEMPGKKLAVMSEARSVDFKLLSALVPVLLKIVGQDLIDTEAKHKNAMSELLECKILLMTNRTPVFPDDTGALAQRLMMVRFDKIFRGTDEEVLGLDRMILEAGIAPILRWHLKGLERLAERKSFVEPEKSVIAKRGLMAQIDPLKTFVEEYFVVNKKSEALHWVSQKDFIRFFRCHLRRIGQSSSNEDKVAQKRASVRSIQTLYPVVQKKRVTRGDGRPWVLQYLVPVTVLELEFADELSDIE